jgi:hypothetical protein
MRQGIALAAILIGAPLAIITAGSVAVLLIWIAVAVERV